MTVFDVAQEIYSATRNVFEYLTQIIPRETEFWAAIVGALVGGVIALMIQLMSLREARRQREQARRELNLSLANSLMFKVIRIHSNFKNVYEHFYSSTFDENGIKKDGEPWQFIQPIVNLPDSINFNSEEMSMALSICNADIFNSLIDMDVVHNSLRDGLRAYEIEREAFGKMIEVDNIDGNLIGGKVHKAKAFPQIIRLRSIFDQIYSQIKSGNKESGDTMMRLHAEFKEKIGIKYSIERK